MRSSSPASAGALVSQLPEPPLVEPSSERLALYFHFEEAPIRADVEIERTEDGDPYATASLRGLAPWTRGVVRVRPQTMGDDVSALFGKRDPSFDEHELDARYFFAGDEADLHAVFRPEVRRVLVAIASEDPSSLVVERGILHMPLGLQRLLSAAGCSRRSARPTPDRMDRFSRVARV